MDFDSVREKLRILSDAAKYDVSCSSSGNERRGKNGQIGSAAAFGICHSWTADGRCVSLLKVLYSNRCVFDCEYCINRRSNEEAERAAFTPMELAELTMEFYRRNYIEGLFLSSAVDGSPDKTAEEIYESLRLLREDFGFLGYIHAKLIPGADQIWVDKIGLLADRLSINIELPTRESLKALAPAKTPEGILGPMRRITDQLAEEKNLIGAGNKYSQYRYKPGLIGNEQLNLDTGSLIFYGAGKNLTLRQIDAKMAEKNKRFAPAGQSTQLMVGASNDSDLQILALSHALYKKMFMRRVYFSAYIPLVDSPLLPQKGSSVPLNREHRLYQADWLMRFYGFSADEIVSKDNPNLDPDLDPKISWALRHMEYFPMEINKASAEELLRIPGVGVLSVQRILRQRRLANLSYDDLKQIGVVLKRAKYFITVNGKFYGKGVAQEDLRTHLLMQSGGQQLEWNISTTAALTGSSAVSMPMSTPILQTQ